MEFLFVLDSEEDAAWQALGLLAKEAPAQAVVRRLVAGAASHCSQKIHK